MKLAARSRQAEQMDAGDLPPETLALILADLGQVNSLTIARRPTIAFLRRALRGRRGFRLLDVGFGDGDMLRAIARWAARRNLGADLVGIDLNPNSAPAARAATPADMPIAYRTGDYARLANEGFDLIVSSLVAHHMSDDELIAFLRFMEAEGRIGWMVNDIHRLRLAYFGFPILARLMRWHRIVREDGRLSIARGLRPAEWAPLLEAAGIPSGTAKVVRRFPFRLCVERLR